MIEMDKEKTRNEKKEWVTPQLTILDAETDTLGSVGIAAADGPLYS